MNQRCAIGVMAKAPVPGHAKTRLLPFLTPEQAAVLSGAFLSDITHNIAAAAEHVALDGWITYAPGGTGHLFNGHIAPGTRLLLADGAIRLPPAVHGLGRSLLHAIQGLLAQGYAAACLVNADSPTLPTTLLIRAATLLLRDPDRVVLGPAEDGGYYLIGMSAPHPILFQDIEWSTLHVTEQTRARAASARLPLTMLDPWYDVDEPALLDRLINELDHPPGGALQPYPAPATTACVSRLGLRERLASRV